MSGAQLPGWLRCPNATARRPVAIILPGLDACKEELHAWSEAFLRAALATLTLDGPGQGESAFRLPVRADWGRVIDAVIDALEQRSDVDGRTSASSARASARSTHRSPPQEPRLMACIANCGPFDLGRHPAEMPAASQETFRVRCHAKTLEAGHRAPLTLEGARPAQSAARFWSCSAPATG